MPYVVLSKAFRTDTKTMIGKGHVTLSKEEHWSRFSSDFEERTNYVVGKQIVEEIRRTVSALRLSGRVLELGCGDGLYTQDISETAETVVATDLSEDMVTAARQRLKDMPHVHVEQQDAVALSYPDATFDAVVMVNLLHVIPDREKAVTESRRVLKPGGGFVVISYTNAGMGLLAKIGMIYRFFRAFGKPPKAMRSLTVAETRAIIETGSVMVKDARLIGTGCKAVVVQGTAC